MKYLIVPALSALLLAGLTAQADAAAQPSPATVPAGAVNNSGPPADGGHGRRPHGGPTTTGGAGVNTTGGANTTGGLFTGGTPRTGRTRQGTGHGQGGATTGGTNTPGGFFPGGPTGHGNATNVGGGHAGTSAFGVRPRNWNRFPRTFDRGTYQRNVTAPRRFRWQTYHRPHGWYARRWTFGQVLPRVFWASDYWLSDYWMFDLPIPPYGYVWVRYGDDALLVNKRTGQILQVVYGLFD